MSILSRLFGNGARREAQDLPAEEYNGFRITPRPAGGKRRLARRRADREAEIDGEAKVHHFLRADVLRDRDEAAAVVAAQGETGDRRAGRADFPLNPARRAAGSGGLRGARGCGLVSG